jgi:hypothetical protein
MYLCHDAIRLDRSDLAEAFRRRALATAAVVGVVVLGGIVVLRADAPGCSTDSPTALFPWCSSPRSPDSRH